MPAVTQLIPNFLGGVSRQNDDKKLLGQVTECVNGYPDPTYGLLKRPGMKHTNVLKKANGTAFTKAELDGAAWFFIERDAAGSYIGAIKGADIYVWTAADGTWCTVTNNGASYLTGTKQNDYHFRSVQDVTVISNKTVTTAMQAAGTFVSGAVATLKLLSLLDSYTYEVKIQNIVTTVTSQNSTTFDDMLLYDGSSINTNHHLVDAIKATIDAQHAASNTDFDGVWYIEGYTNSLVIKRTTGTNAVVTDYSATTGTDVAFSIEAKGGPGNTSLEVFEDDINDIVELPTESFHNHNVRVNNTDSADDDYHLKYVAYNGLRGRGYWKETVARDSSPGLDAATMPYQLENTGALTFALNPIAWKAREAGDDVTSPVPSFIGFPVQASFFYSNRFWFVITR